MMLLLPLLLLLLLGGGSGGGDVSVSRCMCVDVVVATTCKYIQQYREYIVFCPVFLLCSSKFNAVERGHAHAIIYTRSQETSVITLNSIHTETAGQIARATYVCVDVPLQCKKNTHRTSALIFAATPSAYACGSWGPMGPALLASAVATTSLTASFAIFLHMALNPMMTPRFGG